MTALSFDQLIMRLNDAHITVRAEGDRLKVSAPPDAMSEELAAAVREHKPRLLAYLSEQLRPVPASANRDGPPVFCVHGTGGNGLFLRSWGDHVDSICFYAIESPGTTGRTDLASSVADLVTEYVAGVRSVQAEGPYVLGGYSAGGVVAIEMARRMTEEGDDVALVVLLDTFRPDAEARTHGGLERAHQFMTSPVRFTQNVLRKRVLDPLAYEEYARKVVGYLDRGERLPTELREQYMEDHMLSLLSELELAPYDGKVLLVTAADINPVYDHIGADRGWGELVADLEIVPIDSDHHALVGRSRAPQVADAIQRGVLAALDDRAQR